MSKKILTKNNEIYGNWKVLNANVINPNTKNKILIGKNSFSECLCLNCNKTIRFIKNSELKYYKDKKCKQCVLKERHLKGYPKLGDRFGKLVVIGDGGIDEKHLRHLSICQCDCGNIIKVKDNALKTGNTTSCGCQNSRGENIIIQILKENNIIFSHDCIFPELLKETGKKYRFDFIIYNEDGAVNRFIEFDGRQHFYGPDTKYWGRQSQTLEEIKKSDSIKNNFCFSHNYKIARIPFYKINQINIESLLDETFLIKEDD